jgi:hypothetical protein
VRIVLEIIGTPAELLNQHAPLFARQQTDRDVIGEGASGEPHHGFLPRAAATDCSRVSTTPPRE